MHDIVPGVFRKYATLRRLAHRVVLRDFAGLADCPIMSSRDGRRPRIAAAAREDLDAIRDPAGGFVVHPAEGGFAEHLAKSFAMANGKAVS